MQAPRLVHGHPVVASFFHAIGARGESPQPPARDEDATSEEAATSPRRLAGEQPKRKRPRRGQKHSYLVRREEKEALEKEVRELEARAKQLRDAAGITQVNDALATFAVLSEAATSHRLQLATARSVFSELERQSRQSPLHSVIHLPFEWTKRSELMLSLRARKLLEARQFLSARTCHLSTSREDGVATGSYRDESTYTTPDGDVCGVRVEVVPFRGVKSAQSVVDALLFYFIHLEISLSEQTGNTTVREDDDGSAQNPGVLHHRLQISMPDGVVVEKSSVLYVDRNPSPDTLTTVAPGMRELIFVVGDFADEDDRFPYTPRERVRKDISTVLQIAEREPRAPGHEPEVIMTKWQFLKLHAARELQGEGRVPITGVKLEQLHANHMRGLDALVNTMRQYLYGPDA